jgi:hypothetical protein
MWETFWPDVIVAVIGSVVGAILTIGIAYATFLFQQHRSEIQHFRGLIRDISTRRALTVRSPKRIDNAVNEDSYRWANASVVEIREHIKRVRDHIAPDSGVHGILADMLRSCNRYLETSSADPDSYPFHLKALRDELTPAIQQIALTTKRVDALEPGSAAY